MGMDLGMGSGLGINSMHVNLLGVPLCKDTVVDGLTSLKGKWSVYH